MTIQTTLIDILKREVVLALGCTEPVAVALACAWAARAAGGSPDAIRVKVDKNIYKNGLGVGVPGTGEKGLHMAAAVGAVAGDPRLKLEILSTVTEGDVSKANRLIEADQVSIRVESEASQLYVEAVVTAGENQGRARIRDRHDNVTAVLRNTEPFPGFAPRPDRDPSTEDASPQLNRHPIQDFSIDQLFDFITQVPLTRIEFIQRAVDANSAFAEASLQQTELVGVGSKYQTLISKGLLSDDFVSRTKRLLSSAVEARMAGFNMPVSSCAGSGNQGLISTIPVVLAAEQKQCDRERLIRAAALSYLVTVYVKSFMGVLTPVCGGNVAGGMGASCAIVYLFGGGLEDIGRAIKNMAGSVMGVICDGAKVGCALKSTMAVSVAIDNALLALEGVTVPTGDGIVVESADQTIRNMGFVTAPGMSQTDDAILKVMQEAHP